MRRGCRACPRPDKELVSGLGSPGANSWAAAGSKSCITNMDESWALHPKEMCKKWRHWRWMLSSSQTHPLSLSRLGITLSMMVCCRSLFLRYPYTSDLTSAPRLGMCSMIVMGQILLVQICRQIGKVGWESVHCLPLVTACSSFCERVFSLFSHLPAWARSLTCNTALFGEEMPSKHRLCQ